MTHSNRNRYRGLIIHALSLCKPLKLRNYKKNWKQAYCGKLYIHRKVNQKYCPECVQNKISAQLKKKNKSEHCILRQKIYGRLYVRDGAGNNWNYGYGIHDSNSFSEIANIYKKNHTRKQYCEWLKEIEQLTLSKNKK